MRQHLLSKLAAVRRSIYATSSFEFRLAAVLLKFSLDLTIKSFGQILYKTFLKEGVTGMPPINGKPAEEVDPKKIPLDYGSDFASLVYKTLLRRAASFFKGGSQDIVHDVMQEVAASATQGIPEVHGRTLQQARSWILKQTDWRLQDMVRKQRGRGERTRSMESLDVPADPATATPLVEMLQNPRSLPHLYEALAGRDFRKIVPKIERDLKKIDDGAAQYFFALLEDPDATDVELVGDSHKGIPATIPYYVENPVSNTNFRTRIRPKIVDVLKKNLKEFLTDVAA